MGCKADVESRTPALPPGARPAPYCSSWQAHALNSMAGCTREWCGCLLGPGVSILWCRPALGLAWSLLPGFVEQGNPCMHSGFVTGHTATARNRQPVLAALVVASLWGAARCETAWGAGAPVRRRCESRISNVWFEHAKTTLCHASSILCGVRLHQLSLCVGLQSC